MSKQPDAANRFIIVNPALDNVAVCTADFEAGTRLALGENEAIARSPVSRGQRVAIRDIAAGEPVVQYGYPFGASAGIKAGDTVRTDNIIDRLPGITDLVLYSPAETPYPDMYVSRTFSGYKRADGSVGTRNYYLIVPTSECASETAAQIAGLALEKLGIAANFSNVSGIVCIPNTEGCGCAANLQIDRFLRVLRNFIGHPNVGGVLIIDLGCEQTNYSRLFSYLRDNRALPGVPCDWLTIQNEGGSQGTITKALGIIERRLPEINASFRTQQPIEHLVIGTECGASDAFSGITANPVIGNVADKVISGRGSAILSEVPEMVGAERVLKRRMRSPEVAAKFEAMMSWYSNLAETMGVKMSDNLVPENIAGGLINSTIKSLGAIAKGGTSVIQDVVDYGERLTKRGLSIMQGPGNDIESVTGLAASGANIICFSTGKGTVTGSAIVPVIKISTTTELYQRMPEDIDFNAGTLLDACGPVSVEVLGDTLFELVIAVASGQKTRSEINKQRQFQVWTAGKLSL